MLFSAPKTISSHDAIRIARCASVALAIADRGICAVRACTYAQLWFSVAPDNFSWRAGQGFRHLHRHGMVLGPVAFIVWTKVPVTYGFSRPRAVWQHAHIVAATVGRGESAQVRQAVDPDARKKEPSAGCKDFLDSSWLGCATY